MELHSLKPNKGSVQSKKRVGRGEGSTRGGTSTRGHKGAKSRSGFKRKRNHEGGQTPLQMRLPKRGFNSPFKVYYKVLSLDELTHYADKFGVSDLNVDFLREKRIIKKSERVKILGGGQLHTALHVKAHAASQSAMKAIQDAGGSFEAIS